MERKKYLPYVDVGRCGGEREKEGRVRSRGGEREREREGEGESEAWEMKRLRGWRRKM